MTIAIGLVSNNGLVLAADTQETRSGYTKVYRGKVSTSIYPSTGFVTSWAGAGSSDYVKTAIAKAQDGLSDLRSLREITERIEENLLNFFDNTLARWAFFPENERPTVELLIGVGGPKCPSHLFHYSGTAFHQVTAKAIGAGVILADTLIGEFSSPTASVEQLAAVAVHVIATAKDHVDGCGGGTSVITMQRNGDWGGMDRCDVEEVEKTVAELEAESVKELKKRIGQLPVKISWFSQARKKTNRLTQSNAQTSDDQ